MAKYNVAAPRYTSYPTVPYWDEGKPSEKDWLKRVKRTFDLTNIKDGISIYIHLPFCESLCTYCACNTRITTNHQVEEPYIKALLKEWELYLTVLKDRPVIREIHLGGGTPTFFQADQLQTLLQNIVNTSLIHPKAEFSFEGHPANTEEEHLQKLFSFGFRRVSFGIQDFDPVVQDAIHRFQSLEEVKSIVEKARAIGYSSINFDLIYGLPFQTLSGIEHTIQKVIGLKPERIAFYSYAHVPWVKPGQRKFTEQDLPHDTEKRELYERGREFFLEAGYLEIGMDHFALPGDSLSGAAHSGMLHRNFMGYTHNYTALMIGLGVSSISDSGDAYMQNVKGVEEYEKIVQSGKFPMFKGHLLNHEDEIIRKHILNLMCRFATSWESADSRCDHIGEIQSQLEELASDKLIKLYKDRLEVTAEGRSFLRNICMAFDARLKRRSPSSQIFSSVA